MDDRLPLDFVNRDGHIWLECHGGCFKTRLDRNAIESNALKLEEAIEHVINESCLAVKK